MSSSAKVNIKHAGNIVLPRVCKIHGDFEAPWKGRHESLVIVKGTSFLYGIFNPRDIHLDSLKTISINIKDDSHLYNFDDLDYSSYEEILKNHIFTHEMIVFVQKLTNKTRLALAIKKFMKHMKTSISRKYREVCITRKS